MSKWIVDIHGDIEGDYDLICKADKVIPIPDGVTNGDVVENIFGKDAYCTLIRMMFLSCCEKLKDWWNAPYEKEAKK